MRSATSKKIAASFAAAALCLTVVTPVGAAENEKKPKKGRPHQVVPTGAEDAQALTPAELSAEEALDQMLSRSTEGLEVVTREDGTVSADLEGRFMHVSVATTSADGKSRAACVANHAELSKTRKAAAEGNPVSKPAPALEEK